MKVPFKLASGGIDCAAEIFLISFRNGDARIHLLSFSADKRKDLLCVLKRSGGMGD